MEKNYDGIVGYLPYRTRVMYWRIKIQVRICEDKWPTNLSKRRWKLENETTPQDMWGEVNVRFWLISQWSSQMVKGVDFVPQNLMNRTVEMVPFHLIVSVCLPSGISYTLKISQKASASLQLSAVLNAVAYLYPLALMQTSPLCERYVRSVETHVTIIYKYSYSNHLGWVHKCNRRVIFSYGTHLGLYFMNGSLFTLLLTDDDIASGPLLHPSDIFSSLV